MNAIRHPDCRALADIQAERLTIKADTTCLITATRYPARSDEMQTENYVYSPSLEEAIPKNLPPGTPLAGGIYAGITTGKDGQPYALILLTEKPATELTWQGAKDWAAGIEGQLPTRVEGALLLANLRNQFTPAAYWTCEEFDASWAWCQHFSTGNQYSNHKPDKLCASAVRRLPIQSFVI